MRCRFAPVFCCGWGVNSEAGLVGGCCPGCGTVRWCPQFELVHVGLLQLLLLVLFQLPFALPLVRLEL